MTLKFWPEAAPNTVRNFLRYAAEGFYDGKTFHRVISGFMIQGGCPQGTGTGSGPHGKIAGEFSADKKYSHRRGVISMARSNDPNSASCQFFICHGDAPFLDGKYAAFGQVESGTEVLDAVAAVQTGGGGENSRPQQACVIRRMEVVLA
ncbi:MAG: peptidylprolyl isomerase [Planctomycetota bacterium]|nr:MAG: peptidylprolyl isomerase [Planctomycetota bacterium]